MRSRGENFRHYPRRAKLGLGGMGLVKTSAPPVLEPHVQALQGCSRRRWWGARRQKNKKKKTVSLRPVPPRREKSKSRPWPAAPSSKTRNRRQKILTSSGADGDRPLLREGLCEGIGRWRDIRSSRVPRGPLGDHRHEGPAPPAEGKPSRPSLPLDQSGTIRWPPSEAPPGIARPPRARKPRFRRSKTHIRPLATKQKKALEKKDP